jgi:hypothetical protein
MVGQNSGTESGSGQKVCLSRGLPMDLLHVDQVCGGNGNGESGNREAALTYTLPLEC